MHHLLEISAITGTQVALSDESAYAARIMAAQRRGLIGNIWFWAARKYMSNVAYRRWARPLLHLPGC